jgi:hypothetical protein
MGVSPAFLTMILVVIAIVAVVIAVLPDSKTSECKNNGQTQNDCFDPLHHPSMRKGVRLESGCIT